MKTDKNTTELKINFEEAENLPKFVAKYIENSTGDEDVIYGFCVKKDGILYDIDTRRPLLQYVGEKVLHEWELSESTPTPKSSEGLVEANNFISEGIRQWEMLLDDDDFCQLAKVSVKRLNDIRSSLSTITPTTETASEGETFSVVAELIDYLQKGLDNGRSMVSSEFVIERLNVLIPPTQDNEEE